MSAKLALKAMLVTAALGLTACQQAPRVTESAPQAEGQVHIPFEKYQLDNGLTVILHKDTSDPLVHVDVTYHVGSAREEVGKSGFAHFFEHMMFQGSENVADEQHFKIITESGGDLNGTTNTDRTNYFETVPANQLEKVLWLESDRMGYLLSAVDQKKFENQRETVKNERGQNYDNQPYGLRAERTSEALYPPGHPYSWSTIGYVEDLDRVDVNDLKAFFKRWYGPNNAVLTIGGDIDIAQTKQWVKHYFGDIPAGPAVSEPAPQPVKLDEDRYVTLEDKVHLPLLQVTYPTVYARHPDEAPLDVLSDILGGGKTSLFYKNLVKAGFAVQAGVGHPCRELACEFQLIALANPAATPNLAQLNQVMQQTLSEFEQRGVLPDDLARTKASIEASTIYGLQSVAGKVSQLASNETFEGEPDLIAEDLERYGSVTADDVMRVYKKYIKGQHAVYLSIVPEGQSALAVKPQNFTLPEREITPPADVSSDEVTQTAQASFDRSVIPQAGPAPVVQVPDYWKSELIPGVPLLGITSDETPTVTLTISMEGGVLLDSPQTAGLAYITAAMMNESTRNYSNEEMANALAKLGSRINFSAGGRYTQISVSTLTKHLNETMSLLEEKLFNPSFSESDFALMKERMMQSIQQQNKTPTFLAARARDQILFGKENRVSLPDQGTLATLNSLTLEQVKAFYQQYYSPAKASAVVVSNLSASEIKQALAPLQKWQGGDYELDTYQPFPEYDKQNLFFVEQPGAVQSVVYLVRRAMPFDATGKFFKSRLMNFPLGGAFNSRINLNLREDKGFTYGASSGFMGGKTLGWFEAGADLNAPNTAEGLKEIIAEIDRYAKEGMTEQELNFMRSAYTLSDALEFETPASKARFLRQLQSYNLPDDYREQQINIIRNIDLPTLHALAQEQLITSQMQILVVGNRQVLEQQLVPLGIPVTELSVVSALPQAVN